MDDVYSMGGGFMIVSGGHTGADRAGLDWAISNGVRHGGWCPRGRKTENGVLPEVYRLKETPGAGYLQRTEWNLRDSDATLIFTPDDKLDGGSRRTAAFADSLAKPWMHVRPGVHPRYVARFLLRHGVATLNIAGKRASSAPGIEQFVHDMLSQALRANQLLATAQP
ncbi:MAG TPA: hypothetical protein DDX04_19945 [Massilia sp.]|nr:hypothetical protein [Massilia sp.]